MDIKNVPDIMEDCPKERLELDFTTDADDEKRFKDLEQIAIERMTNGELERYIKHYPQLIEKIKHQTEEMQLTAIRENPFVFNRLNNPTNKVILEALQLLGCILKDIKNPSKIMMEAAIKNDPMAIKYIEKPSLRLQMIAISILPEAIEEIEIPHKLALETAEKLIEIKNEESNTEDELDITEEELKQAELDLEK